jgi:hypothetical protein
MAIAPPAAPRRKRRGDGINRRKGRYHDNGNEAD